MGGAKLEGRGSCGCRIARGPLRKDRVKADFVTTSATVQVLRVGDGGFGILTRERAEDGLGGAVSQLARGKLCDPFGSAFGIGFCPALDDGSDGVVALGRFCQLAGKFHCSSGIEFSPTRKQRCDDAGFELAIIERIAPGQECGNIGSVNVTDDLKE